MKGINVVWYTTSMASICPAKNAAIHACDENNPKATICGRKLSSHWFLETNGVYIKSINCARCLKLINGE